MRDSNEPPASGVGPAVPTAPTPRSAYATGGSAARRRACSAAATSAGSSSLRSPSSPNGRLRLPSLADAAVGRASSAKGPPAAAAAPATAAAAGTTGG